MTDPALLLFKNTQSANRHGRARPLSDARRQHPVWRMPRAANWLRHMNGKAQRPTDRATAGQRTAGALPGVATRKARRNPLVRDLSQSLETISRK
jgi:hypothetical protein